MLSLKWVGMIFKVKDFNLKALILSLLCITASACAPIVSNVTEDLAANLTVAVLNQEDPEIVYHGAPAYLLLLDSLVEGSPNNPTILSSAASLYASYGAIFADDEVRAKILSKRALQYSKQALCISYKVSCYWDDYPFEVYLSAVDSIKPKYSDLILTHSIASLVYIRAHSDDWNAIARLPHIQALLEHYLLIEPNGLNLDSVYMYLGILSTLRPPALGGDFIEGRKYFELAIKLSGEKNLSAKVEYALGYARPLYDRELHDKLLNEVLLAEPIEKNYTLLNVLAQKQAKELLKNADDYF